jgi:hypothetical protein
MGYGLDNPVLIPIMARFFSSLQRPVLGPTYPMSTGAIFSGVKRPDYEAEH